MCACNPSLRTPWCGRGTCVTPPQAVVVALSSLPSAELLERARDMARRETVARQALANAIAQRDAADEHLATVIDARRELEAALLMAIEREND